MAKKSKKIKPLLKSVHISIHDVTPESLKRVQSMMDELNLDDLLPITLLVVPGKDWQPHDIDVLRDWEAKGYKLAGHGWSHKLVKAKFWLSRLYGEVLTDHVAEHLGLDGEEILQLIQRNYQWFRSHQLKAPTLYVPPAWAMGAVPRGRLTELPFKYYEELSGFYEPKSRKTEKWPVVGYEANAWWRGLALNLWNRMQRFQAPTAKGLRIAIHPNDLNLPLKHVLRSDIKKIKRKQYERVVY